MIDDLAIEAIAERVAKHFERVNTKTLQRIGEKIGAAKGMTISDVHKIKQLYNFGADADQIIADIARESAKAQAEIRGLIETVAKDSYIDASVFYKAAGVTQIPYAQNGILQQYVKSLQDLTAGTFANYSNTSVIGFRKLDAAGKTIYRGLAETYKDTIDQAVTELSMGVTDFNSAMRSTLKELADSGIRVVDYESGTSRRLDSAVRQNILDTTRAVAQGIQRQAGREFGSNGVELSAHATCAADHLSYQGKQYSHAEYDEIQSSLKRQIGEYNCRHFTYEIILGVSEPAYTEEELSELERLSNEKKTFEGQEYTRYEATQLQRKIETAIRKSKDRANIAKASGDNTLRRTEQGRINQLKHKYQDVCKTFDLPYMSERMAVSGFRPVKAIDNPRVVSNLHSKFGITNVNLNGLSGEVSRSVEKAVADIMTEYPQLIGFVQSLEVNTSRPSVASATLSVRNEDIKTSLQLNPTLLADQQSIDKMIDSAVSTGFWTKKDGIKGIIEHEMAHMLEYSQAFVEAGVNPFSTDPNDLVLKMQAINVISNREISERVVTQAFNNLGLQVNYATITTEISEYGTRNFSETFAEAISDAGHKRVSREIIRIVKGGF